MAGLEIRVKSDGTKTAYMATHWINGKEKDIDGWEMRFPDGTEIPQIRRGDDAPQRTKRTSRTNNKNKKVRRQTPGREEANGIGRRTYRISGWKSHRVRPTAWSPHATRYVRRPYKG
jgi:hypothetical protein